jgi:predicted nucleic acid-binding protein
MRAVLDTNIIVSGVIKEEGPSGKILRFLLQERKFISVTSLEILGRNSGSPSPGKDSEIPRMDT